MTARQHRQCRDDPGMFEAFAALPPMPSFGQRVVNAATAVGRVAKAAVKKEFVTVPEAVRAERQAACETCPKEETRTLGIKWCGACGCVLAAKQRLATETCPLGRWPPQLADGVDREG